MSSVETNISRARFDAVIFDLDGVITRTAKLHAQAWKQTFDEYLRRRSRKEGKDYAPFDIDSDYRRYVDGKPRYDGVEAFLAQRSLKLPRGAREDPPSAETVCGIGNRKNELFRQLLEREGAEVYEHAMTLIRRLRAAGFKTAVVSSSKNCVPILESVHALVLFDAKVDGADAEARGLAGKPAPDLFLAAANTLAVDPGRAVVVEDALVGVAAGRAGNFGLVVGVDRANQADALREHGADVVVSDLGKLEVAARDPDEKVHEVPSALDRFDEIAQRIRERRPVVFLDFDGTLAPIVDRPELAVIDAAARDAVLRLTRLCPVAVISGRDLADVRSRVGIEGIHYAGSHGFDIAGPGGLHHEHPKAAEALPALDAAERALNTSLKPITGALVERKRFSLAAHYRLVRPEDVASVEGAVDAALSRADGLRKGYGKKVFELQPDINWNKGAAVLWLLRALDLDRADVLPIYVGDDVTDEDAFRALAARGIGIAVLEEPRPTAAHYRVNDPEAVSVVLADIADTLERTP